MTIIKKMTIPSVREDVEQNQNSQKLLVGMQPVTATVEISVAVPDQVKYTFTYKLAILLQGIDSEGTKT